MLGRTHLQRRDMCIEEILSHAITLVQLTTHTRRTKTGPDPIPLIGVPDPSLEPTRVVIQTILQVSPARDSVTRAFKRNHVNKHNQASEQHNHHKHSDEVRYK